MGAADLAVNIAWLAVAIILAYVLYRLGKWLYGLYQDFTAPGGKAEEDIVNMFTPHGPDGTVSPKDVPLKSADPVDWIFMNHALSEPV